MITIRLVLLLVALVIIYPIMVYAALWLVEWIDKKKGGCNENC